MITRKQAYDKVTELIKNKNLIKHCLAVEASMKEYAAFFNVPENERETWSVAGLLHDADWEQFPDKHPNVIVQWIKENDGGEELVNAVEAHGFQFGVAAKTLMAKTLRAVDELTGLIVAVALVKDKKLDSVTVDSIKRKWGVSSFARGVHREDITRGASDIGVMLDIHIKIVLSAMQKIAAELELG